MNNLSKKRIDALAAKLDKKHPDLKEDAEHDKVIEEFHELFPLDEIAKTDDRVSSLEAEIKKPKDDTDKDKDDSKKKDKPKKTDEPEESSTDKLLKELLSKVSKLETDKTQASITQKISSHEKVKGIPETFWNKRKLPEKEEDAEAFIEDVAKDYADLKQSMADEGFEQVTKPVNGTKPTNAKDKVSPEMAAYLKDKKEQQEAQQKTS